MLLVVCGSMLYVSYSCVYDGVKGDKQWIIRNLFHTHCHVLGRHTIERDWFIYSASIAFSFRSNSLSSPIQIPPSYRTNLFVDIAFKILSIGSNCLCAECAITFPCNCNASLVQPASVHLKCTIAAWLGNSCHVSSNSGIQD